MDRIDAVRIGPPAALAAMTPLPWKTPGLAVAATDGRPWL
jgi:hypothetical protein